MRTELNFGLEGREDQAYWCLFSLCVCGGGRVQAEQEARGS